MPPKHDDAVVEDATKGSLWVENLGLRIGTVAAIAIFVIGCLGTFVALVVWAVNLQNDVRGVQRDVTAIKSSVSGLSQISELQLKLEDLRKNGSDAVRDLSKELEQLRTEFRVHVLTTVTN